MLSSEINNVLPQSDVNYHQIERDRKRYLNPIDVEYNVGLIESNPVIVSVKNKYFW